MSEGYVEFEDSKNLRILNGVKKENVKSLKSTESGPGFESSKNFIPNRFQPLNVAINERVKNPMPEEAGSAMALDDDPIFSNKDRSD